MGVFEVRVYVGRDPRTGREKYLSRTHRGGIRGAHALERKLIDEVAAGEVPRSTSTVHELLTTWLDHARPNLSPTTVRGYESAISARIGPDLGSVAVDCRPPHRSRPRARPRLRLAEIEKSSIFD